MYRTLLLTALLGLGFAACKPTQRKVPAPKQNTEQQAQQQNAKPAAESPQKEAPQKVEPQALAQACTDCLLDVTAVTQNYNVIRPWEKDNPSRTTKSGIYVGDGHVLVSGIPLRAATYVELSLPDASKTVTARVVKYDADLGMGLLAVAHETDSDIFATRKAYPVGEPLKIGDMAEFWYLINDTMPAKADLLAESGGTASSMPCINLKAAKAITGAAVSTGAPIFRDGKLVGVVQSYDQGAQLLSCTNAELVKRFLEEDPEVAAAGGPVLGLSFELLADPVFRRYLHLDGSQTGLYVSKVQPHGAAASAGIQEGDVVTAVEGMPVDNQGRCNHPSYGPVSAACLATTMKPSGQKIRLTLSRGGETMVVEVPLNRDAREKSLVREDKPGVQPRYIIWGGVVFQVVTKQYLNAVRGAAGSLPAQFLRISSREKDLREEGVTELVSLSGTIPTPATLGYENLGGCLVEKVNGKRIHNFHEFEEALDAPTKDGIVEICIDRAPYKVYIDTQTAEAANDALRRSAIHSLRHSGLDPRK